MVDKYLGQLNEYPEFNKAITQTYQPNQPNQPNQLTQLKGCSNCGTPCAGASTDNNDPCLSWSLRPLRP